MGTEVRGWDQVRALVYFDTDRTSLGHYDWMLDSSPEAYSA